MNTLMKTILPFLPQNVEPDYFGNTISFEVPALDLVQIARMLYDKNKLELKLITATDERIDQGCFKIWYVFGAPVKNAFIIPYIRLADTLEFPSLTHILHQAWNHEKKIHTFFGLRPKGHPDLRPLILHENWPATVFPLRKDFKWDMRPEQAHESYHFQKVKGEGIYEIPVGPVHAGIIEPGHLRFSVAGEDILLLEPRLGYTHKGAEKLFEQLPLDGKLRLSEKISGDSSFSHSLAFCQALEQLKGITPPRRALYLRVIYAELERLANHLGDIGAIMLDSGFNFGGSQDSRLRELIMRINSRLTGSRFLRGVNAIGGVHKDVTDDHKETLLADLKDISDDFSGVMDASENSDTLLNRIKSTGMISREVAKAHGVVGVAAKAVGISIDARVDFPYAAYSELGYEQVKTELAGDIYARFRIRVKEVYASIRLIQKALQNLPQGPILNTGNDSPFKKNGIAISIVEGWRGDIVYFVATDSQGNISRVAPRDPSFMNWPALEYAVLDNIIPDFPLINKSFNLSYSGNDL